jgi:septum formation protein
MPLWYAPGKPVILASQSPRRKVILAQMGLAFTSLTPHVPDESFYINMSGLVDSLKALAITKARSIAKIHPGALVLGADTVVVLDRNVLGKPADIDQAREMLVNLSNRKHQVMTGVALVCASDAFAAAAVACTDVFFRKLPGNEIDDYLDLGEYRDKAGAYAIQGRASVFIDRIEGCYYNVVGLPVSETIALFDAYLNRSMEHHE